MKKFTSVKKGFLVFTFFLFNTAFSQTYFQKTFASSPYDQEAQDVLPTADGGYIFTGYTTNSTINDCDVLVIKSDAVGNELWRKSYGGNKPDFPYHMLETTDGNYFLVGYSQSYGGGDYDILLIKINPSGDTLWKKTYGSWGNDLARDVIATSDGNYMIVGWSKAPGQPANNANLIKIDPSGTVLWNKMYGGAADDYGNCVKQTSDGGYIMIGQTFNGGAGGGDAWLVKLDSNGDTTWTKRYGGAQNDEGYYITIAPDGGYVFLIRDSSNAGQDIDTRIIKTDATGNVVWNKLYGGDRKDTPKMIQNTSDGGFIACGNSRSFGWINPDMWILKLNSGGDTTWTRHYGGSQNEHCYVIREMADGSYIATGKSASYGPDFDPIFLKLNPEGKIVVGQREFSLAAENIRLYPNPAKGHLTVNITGADIEEISITNLLGQEIYSIGLKNEEQISIDLHQNNPGVYFLSCKTHSQTITKKFIVN